MTAAPKLPPAARAKRLGLSRTPPRTRSECKGGPRPCEHTACAFHLLPEVRRYNPGARLATLADSCLLDVCDEGGASPERVARALGVSPQAVDQTEKRALAKIREVECAPDPDPADAIHDRLMGFDFDRQGPGAGDE